MIVIICHQFQFKRHQRVDKSPASERGVVVVVGWGVIITFASVVIVGVPLAAAIVNHPADAAAAATILKCIQT